MAGTPKKRARREADERTNARAPHAPAPRARGARAEVAPPIRPTGRGPELKAVADSLHAGAVAELARHLQAAVKVRIKRLRPTWCRGWIEDFPLSSADVGELLEYLRIEHGGQDYELLLLTDSEEPIYTTTYPIFGPPRDRGRPINREKYEAAIDGRSQDQAAAAAAAPAGLGALEGLASIFRLILDESREARNATLEAVREQTARQAENTERLMKHVIDTRAQAEKNASLGTQLAEFSESVKAVEKVKTALAPKDSPTNGRSPMDSALHDVATDFLKKVVASKVPNQAAPPSAPIPESGQEPRKGA